MKPPRSHLVLAILASASLYWAWQLSSAPRKSGPPRGPVDWIVIGLLCLAIAWHLVQLGRRLYRHGRGQDVWHLQRTLLFWIVGLMNTAGIRARFVGSWKNWVGVVLLVIAALDTYELYRKELSSAGEPRAQV